MSQFQGHVNDLNLTIDERKRLIHIIYEYREDRSIAKFVKRLVFLLQPVEELEIFKDIRCIILKQHVSDYDFLLKSHLFGTEKITSVKSHSRNRTAPSVRSKDFYQTTTNSYLSIPRSRSNSSVNKNKVRDHQEDTKTYPVYNVKIDQRLSTNSSIGFSVRGGSDYGLGIFISSVDKGSTAEQAGLQFGDRIIEVNGTNFENITHTDAVQLIRSHSCLLLKVQAVGKIPISRDVDDNNYVWWQGERSNLYYETIRSVSSRSSSTSSPVKSILKSYSPKTSRHAQTLGISPEPNVSTEHASTQTEVALLQREYYDSLKKQKSSHLKATEINEDYLNDGHVLKSTASATIPESVKSKNRHRKSYTDGHKTFPHQHEYKQHIKEENKHRSRSVSDLHLSKDAGVHRNIINSIQGRESARKTWQSDVPHRRNAMSSEGYNRGNKVQLTKRSKSPHNGTFKNLIPEKTASYLQNHKLSKERHQTDRTRTKHCGRLYSSNDSLKIKPNDRWLLQKDQHHHDHHTRALYVDHDSSDSDEDFSWPDIPNGVVEYHGDSNNHAFDHAHQPENTEDVQLNPRFFS